MDYPRNKRNGMVAVPGGKGLYSTTRGVQIHKENSSGVLSRPIKLLECSTGS